jgi:cysteine-rich repeat protein
MVRKGVGIVLLLVLAVFFIGFVSSASCSITSSCAAANTVMRLSSSSNAHGELYDQGNYGSYLCCDFTGTHTCTGSNNVLRLSSATNAHAEIPSSSTYSNRVCFGELTCYSTSGSCNSGDMQMVSLSSATNAHIGGFGDYSTKICCNPNTLPECPATCDDGNACTIDGTCNPAVGTCPAKTAVTCNDNNPCTSDSCSPSSGCVYTPLTGTACTSDGNECTDDVCSSSGTCAHNALTGTACSSDGNPCTSDVCSSSGTCAHNALTGTACTSDNDPCTTDICSSSGTCTHNIINSCTNNDGLCCGSCTYLNDNDCAQCSVNSDCNDGNACTTDTCSGGSCSHNAISGCCTSSAQCNDGNACTTDLCSSNTCSHPSISNCCTSSAQCGGSQTCVGNVCTNPSAYCGDGTCNNGETCSTCSDDCGSCSPSAYCGDGTCNNGETCSTCSDDCGSCSPSAYCGDGTCNNGEDCSSCPTDCGTCDKCGDGRCNNGETCSTCDTDCGCASNEVCQGGSCVALCGNGIINAGEDCDGANLGGETCASILGPEYTGTLGCSSCYFDTSGCYLACDLTSAAWSTTSALEGAQVKLNLNGQNCDGAIISFTVMEKDGFLNPDDPVETDPASITYGSPNTYGIWKAEWQDDSEFGQSNPPEYYFTATVEGTGKTITSSKADGDMLNVYQKDVVCSGVDYCSNYLTEAECGVDLCSVRVDSSPSSVSCGGTFNSETGCYDYTNCGCAWNSDAGTCEASWQVESGCGVCGNHIKDTGEQCDDGNLIDLDGCSSTCQFESGINSPCSEGLTLCSDGTCSLNCDVTDSGVAPCDYDGVCDVGEGCTCKDCNNEQDTCQNGLICNIVNSACCSSTSDKQCNPYCSYVDPDCSPAVCGNGFKEVGEECDLGTRNNDSNSGCSSTCKYVVLEPPCPEGTDLCNDNTCSLNCYATDKGIKGCGDAGTCAAGLQCSADDKACCKTSSDGYCNSYCASVDPDCKTKLLDQGIFSIGTCLYTENGKDTCADDGMLTRSLSAQWNWSAENSFNSNPDGLDYWQPSGSEIFRYDPLDYSGLRKSQSCVYIEDTFACPASAQVSFFGIYQFAIAIALIAAVYLIYALTKKKNSKHTRRHSKITGKKRKK